ncbi:serine/threonine protein kinase [Burkholderia cepacia]|uniref:serine/threonine-protein kinase n=1 Tax=Burkholderia cepacia TaxID=292 RepID=UPI00075F9DF9|nr:serine/threonine-protein kinase [Burkholderia cepacia]KWE19432.1 serine/threonine protein kinase [Burkholderia cepacia]
MKDAGSRDNEHDTATRGDASEFTVRPLPLGHRLGELQLDEVLGIGGFGIVYRAFDRTLRRAVAIKEYMPSMLATRGGDYTVSLRSERFAQAFDAGRGAFLNEARLLAQFDHPGLVKVLHFWESHGTAYMVMPFYEGRTLKQLLDGGMRISETQLRNIVGALLGALDTLHRAQCFHRDVALDNVLIRPNGSAILLDFGAARKRIGDLVDDGAMMIKPGYAPIEQYTDDPAFSQGPWTDLYALGAVMHAMITGELPPAAVVRSIKDTYRPLASRELPAGEVYSPAFLAAVDHALQLRIPDRPESVAAFAAELGLRDFDRTGSGYGAPAVPPVGDAGRGGEDKGAASVEAGTASAAAATSIGAGGAASGSAAPDGQPPTQAGADPVSTPTDTASASPGMSNGKPETDDVSPTLKAATHGAAATAAAGALAASASHASRPAAKPVESDAPNGDVERAKEPAAARTDPHDETGARSARPDTDIGARGAAGSGKADAFAAEGAGAGVGVSAASTTAPYPAASSSASSGGASVPPGAQHSQAPAGSRKRRLPVYAGGAVVALIAVGLAATYLSRPARVADEPAPGASQPQAGTSPPASAPAATLAQQGPTPIVVPPSSLPAGSSAQVPPPRVAAEPASTPAVEAAPQVATTVTNTAPPPAGASPAIAPAGSLDASERVVNVPPSEAAVPPVTTPTPAPKPPDSQTAVAAVNALPAEQQPRAPKAQETVQVRFNVRPWGDVYVNGARRGASPPLRSVSLTPGVYVIEIRNGSLPPLHRTVAIDFGSKPVNIDYAFE